MKTIETLVAGAYFYPANRKLSPLKLYKAQPRREETNPYDPNAIALYVNGEKVGYVPREYTGLYTPAVTEYRITVGYQKLNLFIYPQGRQAVIDEDRYDDTE